MTQKSNIHIETLMQAIASIKNQEEALHFFTDL